MSFFKQQKQKFIRWYGGHFVNDPNAETFSFGLYMPLNAIRLHRILRRLGLR